jgi:hypothetical protein
MSNREWLKNVTAETAMLALDGVHRLETGRTVYVFRDGVCVDIARRDGEEQSNAEISLVGTRLVGWLLDIEGQRRLLNRWLPGARGVLWREAKIAVTSPSFGFVQCSQPDEDEDDDVDDCATTAEWVPVPSRPIATGSFTRLFPQEP